MGARSRAVIDSGDELFVEKARKCVPPLQRSGTRLGDAQSGRVRMLVSYSTLGRCLQAGAMNAFADTSQTSFVWYTAPTFYRLSWQAPALHVFEPAFAWLGEPLQHIRVLISRCCPNLNRTQEIATAQLKTGHELLYHSNH